MVHKAEAGNAPNTANEELSVAWSRTLEFPDGSGRETNACSLAKEALTAWTTAARNSGDGWAALPATGVWCAVRGTSYGLRRTNSRMQWNRRCGRTIRCTGCEKGSILTVTSATSASRARHILQLKAIIRKDQLKNASVRYNVCHKISKRPCCHPTDQKRLRRRPLTALACNLTLPKLHLATLLNPTILENAPCYFTVRVICKLTLTARQDR